MYVWANMCNVNHGVLRRHFYLFRWTRTKDGFVILFHNRSSLFPTSLESASSPGCSVNQLPQPRNCVSDFSLTVRDSQRSTNDRWYQQFYVISQSRKKLAMTDGHPSTDQPRQAWLNLEDWPVQLLLISHQLLNIVYKILCLYSNSTSTYVMVVVISRSMHKICYILMVISALWMSTWCY